MAKKYKHISLPKRLIAAQEIYAPNKGRAFETLPVINFERQGKTIARKLKQIQKYTEKKIPSLIFEEDKRKSEIVLKFRSRKGFINQALLDKYRIDIFQQKDKNTFYGRISNELLPGQVKSDFQALQEGVDHFSKTNEGRSYFKNIQTIKPLSLDELIDSELKKELTEHPSKSIFVDISFAEGGELTDLKFKNLEEKFGDKFASKLNTTFVHFCRIKLNSEELEETAKSFSGITHIDLTPPFTVAPSFVEHSLDTNTQIIPPVTGTPVLILDTAVNSQHVVIRDAIIATEGAQSGDVSHATMVASLVTCGPNIRPTGEIKQHNQIIVVNVFEQSINLEARIDEIVKKYAQIYPLVLINLSLNQYRATGRPYERKPVSNLTKLIDELCWKYNCLVITSAGNLDKGLDPSAKTILFGEQYPSFFESIHTCILPPADAINGITVGSIAYQESANSVSKIKQPTPDTRGNLKDNFFVKPDFVNYDSNWEKTSTGYYPEFNGPFLAGANNNTLTKSAGTSFATPLVSHCAGILHNLYPDYSNNAIKALMIHTADNLNSFSLRSKKIQRRLVGHGMPNIETARFSVNSASTIVVEDSIAINHKKKIRIPIPSSIAGSSRKRLIIKTTLVYNPPINSINTRTYNPIDISARLLREDGKPVSRFSTKGKLSESFSKSNVKRNTENFSTTKHTGTFWELEVECESILQDLHSKLGLQSNYLQPYAIVVTIADMLADENIDLHTEISQMIEISLPIEIEVGAV